ncbi:hypothetical protein [Sphingopyxis terrae]|nr:hypothetical protein [Sphingopyxis terrae]
MTLLAFWPGYFSRLGTAKIAWHIHAVTATAWMLLLAAQSWSIDRGERARHRSLGLAIFILVPMFMVGALICPLLSGPKLMIFWTTKEI